MFALVTSIIAALIYATVGIAIFSVVAPRVAWARSKNYKWQTKPDEADRMDGTIAGILMGSSWPVAIPAWYLFKTVRFVVKGFFSKVSGAVSPNGDFWAEPEPLRSPVKAIKEHRLAERERVVNESRQIINEREKELGFELTKW